MKRAIEVVETPTVEPSPKIAPAAVAVVAGLAGRLEFAKNILAEIQRIEGGMMDLRERLFQHAWYLGQELIAMKEEVGHGKWQVYLEGHWPDLDPRDGRRYMAFFDANPQDLKRRNSGVLTYTTESIRKFMWDYIPVKERPELPGDVSIPPITHQLTFANAWSKFRRQLSLGRVPQPAPEVLLRDCGFVVREMAEMVGRARLLELLESLPAEAAA